jgi:hypothetical protein
MCSHELARIANEAEIMVGVTYPNYIEHHCLNQLTTKRQEHAIANLALRLNTMQHLLVRRSTAIQVDDKGSTVNIYTGEYLGN